MCDVCKKKTVIVFTCVCSKKTCIKHRLPETHDCSHTPELFSLKPKLPKNKVIKI